MRKSKLFTAGVLALVLALGLVLAGCGGDDDGGTTFTVSYDVGAGSGTPPSNQTVNSGQSINLPGQGNMTSPSGDSFNGWRTGGVNYSAGDSYTVTGNVTFTAQWGSSGGGGGTAVTLNSVSANGSSSQTTTELTLTFSAAITGLSAGDITLSGVSGVSNGSLNGSNPYTLTISGFTSGGTLSVAVAKSGYTISGSPQTATIFYSGTSGGGGGNTAVTFSSVTANGSSSQTTTQLTLTFSQAITGLSASDITLTGVSGVSGGTLSGSNPYTLTISGFTSGGTLSVAVAKSGYTISGSPKTAAIFYSGTSGGGGNTAVTFSSVSANGSSSQTTTQLTLNFSAAITGLSASDITLSGVSVTKGSLSGSNPYTLSISGFSSGGTLNVAVSKSGYTISGSPKSTTIYYSSGGGGTTEYRLDQPIFGTSSRSGNNITINWSLTTSGLTPNGLYTYTSPSSIIIQVYNGTSFDDFTTLSGSARSYTLNNYAALAYSPAGVSGNRVTIRVLCKSTYGDRYSTITYFVEQNSFTPSY